MKEKGFDRQDTIYSQGSVRLAKKWEFDRQEIDWMENGLSIDIDIPKVEVKYEEKKKERRIEKWEYREVIDQSRFLNER